MIAYLNKNPANATWKLTLTICAKPCNGPEFTAARKVHVNDKSTAIKICKAEDITPFNF